MKKIVFLMPFYAFPVPSTMGGGVEELMTLLLNENELQQNPEYEFYFITKNLYGKKKKYNCINEYKNSKVIKIKYNRFVNTCIRIINRVLKILKIKKRFANLYYQKCFKTIKEINPDHIVFERDYDSDTKKYAKYFGKDKLSFHIHTQILNKEDLSDKFGSLISVSNFISDDWKNFLKNKDMNYYVLPNCVDEKRFTKTISKKERDLLRANYGLTKNDFAVIFCGRICEDKGIDKLIEAILPMDKSIKLLIVGSVSALTNQTTPFYNKIKSLAFENSDRIKFTGYIDNSELYKTYQCADIQIVPSIWEEAAGLVVIEGQHSGLPQIITRSGGMTEYANPDGTIIIEKDEHIVSSLKEQIQQLKDNKHKEEMAKSNKKHALLFNEVSYYKNFVNIVDKLLNNKK